MRRSVATDLTRLQEIARVVIRHGYGHLAARNQALKAAADSEAPSADQAAKPPTLSSAERFARMLEELGPTFVKLGQILSTRTDILPPTFVEALSRLQDDVPPLDFPIIRQVLQDALGKPTHEVFNELSPTPLASASIAQVHAAKLRDGQEVVVKIQRPNIRVRMQSDISLLSSLASLFDAVFEEAGIYHSRMVVEEFETALLAELDFSQELRNIQAFAGKQQDKQRFRVPKVYPELSSKTVLVMEMMRGTRLSDLPPTTDRAALAMRFLEAAFEQVFVDGLFHGDPHPGNVLIQDDGSIALLDFGLVGRLPRDSQDRLVALLLAVALRDPDSLARLLYRIGAPDERVSLSAFRGGIATLLDRYFGLALQDIRSQALMRDLMDLAVRHRIRIPREYAVLAKAAVTFEGVIRMMHPQLDVAAVAAPYAIKLLKERYDPRHIEGGAPRLLLQLIGFAQDLPLQASQILLDLEAGKLTVQVAGSDIRKLSRSVRMLAASVVSASLVASLVLGAMPELMKLDWRIFGLPVLPLLAMGGAFMLVVVSLVYVMWDGRLPKLKLAPLLKRMDPDA